MGIAEPTYRSATTRSKIGKRGVIGRVSLPTLTTDTDVGLGLAISGRRSRPLRGFQWFRWSRRSTELMIGTSAWLVLVGVYSPALL